MDVPLAKSRPVCSLKTVKAGKTIEVMRYKITVKMKALVSSFALVLLAPLLPTGCGSKTKDLASYDKEVQRNPTNPGSYDRRGWARGVKGELDGAISDFNEAIRLNPSDATAFGLRGKAFSDKGELDKAVSDLTEAIRLNPNDALAYQNRGYICFKKGELESALRDLNEAIRLDPNLAVAYGNRGSTYSKMGEFGKALGDLNEAIRLAPQDGKAYNSLAWLLATCPDASVRNGTKAVEAAKRACELEAWKTWYCIGTLGAAYAESGDFHQAVDFQNRAMNMPGFADSDRADAEKRLILYRQGKPYHEPAKR
jgi:tetratricopeptide (TPR) repeat protein